MGTEKDTVFWPDYSSVSGSFSVGFTQLGSEKTATRFKARALIAYLVHAMHFNFSPSGIDCKSTSNIIWSGFYQLAMWKAGSTLLGIMLHRHIGSLPGPIFKWNLLIHQHQMFQVRCQKWRRLLGPKRCCWSH